MNKAILYLSIILIIIAALFLRVYKLDRVPPELFWDEVSVGYNAFSIANYGVDEWGKSFPLVFKSFGEYKNPVHIYVTAIFVKILGLSDFTTRLPSALFGVLNVILLYFLAVILFKSKALGLISAFVLAISPYNIQFSRFNHELNFAIFFLLLGLILFYKAIQNHETRYKLLPFSLVFFFLSMLSYNGAKIFIPVFFVVLFVIYFKELKSIRHLWISGVLVALFILVILLNPNLLGLERLRQTSPGQVDVESTNLYKKTNIALLGRGELIANRYLPHFDPAYLFISGDKNPRHSIQTVGEFYKIDSIFLTVGLLVLLYQILKNRKKEFLLLTAWAFLGPLPAALTNEAPHAARAMFTNGSWHIVLALGIYTIIMLLKNRLAKIAIGIVMIFAIGWEFKSYIKDYYQNYPTRYAIEWQYGMKQIGQYIKRNDDVYHTVYMTNVRHQPYIFLLYYLKISAINFKRVAVHNTSESVGYNNVLSFDKYNFEWDTVNSDPEAGVLYILTPSEYSGLAQINNFEVKKVIKYPNGGDAFFLIAAKDITNE